MISSLILSVMMTFIVFIFVVFVGNFSTGSLVYAVFLLFLFCGMTFSERKKKGSGVIYRRIFQTVFAVGFCIAFISDLFAERGSMAITNQAMSNAELPFCHIAIPQSLLPLLITKSIIFPARISGHYAAAGAAGSAFTVAGKKASRTSPGNPASDCFPRTWSCGRFTSASSASYCSRVSARWRASTASGSAPSSWSPNTAR